MQQPVAETEELGLPLMRVLATAIVVRENRGLHVPKLLALKASISLDLWNITRVVAGRATPGRRHVLVGGWPAPAESCVGVNHGQQSTG